MDPANLVRELYPYVCLIYLLHSLVKVDKSGVLFVSYLGRKFTTNDPGVHLCAFSPLGDSILSADLPLILARDGVFIVSPSGRATPCYLPEDYRYIPYEEIKNADSRGAWLRLGGKKILKAPSSPVAALWAAKVSALSRATPAEREVDTKRDTEEALCPSSCATLRDAYASRIRWAKITGTVFLVLFFGSAALVGYLPLEYRYRGFTFGGLPALPVLFYALPTALVCGFYAAGFASAYLAHKALEPQEKALRTSIMAGILFFPPSLAQFPHHLSRDLLRRFDYTAIAAAVLGRSTFAAFARRELWRLRHSIALAGKGSFSESLRLRQAALEILASEAGLSPEEMNRPPSPSSEQAFAYCPICLAEYVEGVTSCSDCRVVRLEPYRR